MQTRALSHFSLRNPRVVMLLLAMIAVVPLIIPDFPPLTDLPGHLGRYAVQIGRSSDPVLAGWFSFDRALIGNLGVDILMELLGPWLGVELAAKLIVIGIVAFSVTGIMAVQRAALGRIGPAALFALPLVYGFPFQFGFINYCLSMAIALHAFAVWIRLGQAGRFRFRAALFVPLSLIVWLAHIGGWGALGLMAFAAEVVRLRAAGRSILRVLPEAALHCLPLVLPVLVTIATRSSGAAGDTMDWFHWITKFQWFAMALSDRWQRFDLYCVGIIAFLIAAAAILPAFRFNRTLGLATLLLFGAFLIIPRILIGSAYADMRLAPFIAMLALIAIDVRPGTSRWVGGTLMAAGLVFFLVRTASTTISFYGYGQEMRAELAALDHVPRHARIVALVGRKCYAQWQLERKTHLPSLAIVRRHAFTNDQFVMPGAQLIGVTHTAGMPFNTDPSQMVTDDHCIRRDWMTYTKAPTLIPRNAFDYLWVIDAPEDSKADLRSFTPVWRHGRSALYRIHE
jgi:hypothetical protein